jgi:hypothetical protein
MSFEVLATTDINAPPPVVWRVLTDVHSWAAWSTWLVWEGGAMKKGERVQLRLTPPDGGGYAFSPEVLILEEDRHLAWVGRTGLPGVFDGEHHFVLTPTATGTRLENRERYSGLLSPLMQRLPMMKGAEAGFAALNDEIRRRAEALAASDPTP